MEPIDSNLQCPSCHAELRPALLVCDTCQIRVEGPFRLNEFANLAPDDLHFLRIFVQSEGRIRDMEAALGLSYPTIRTRLTALKDKLATRAEYAPEAGEEPRAPPTTTARATTVAGARTAGRADGAALKEILDQLEAGAIPFDEALRRIRETRSK